MIVFVCLSVCLFVCMFISMSICISVCLSLSVSLYLSLSKYESPFIHTTERCSSHQPSGLWSNTHGDSAIGTISTKNITFQPFSRLSEYKHFTSCCFVMLFVQVLLNFVFKTFFSRNSLFFVLFFIIILVCIFILKPCVCVYIYIYIYIARERPKPRLGLAKLGCFNCAT